MYIPKYLSMLLVLTPRLSLLKSIAHNYDLCFRICVASDFKSLNNIAPWKSLETRLDSHKGIIVSVYVPTSTGFHTGGVETRGFPPQSPVFPPKNFEIDKVNNQCNEIQIRC